MLQLPSTVSSIENKTFPCDHSNISSRVSESYSFCIYLLCLMFFFMISLVFASSFFFFFSHCASETFVFFFFFPQAASVCTILMVMVLVETAATSNTIRSLKPKKKSASAPTETVPLQLDNRSLVLNNTIRSLENCSISPWSYKYESTLWLRLRTMLNANPLNIKYMALLDIFLFLLIYT